MNFIRTIRKFAFVALSTAALAACTRDTGLEKYKSLCRDHIYADYKQMYRDGGRGAFIHPFLTPGSKSYSNVLWDWDSYFCDVALRQILQDTGTAADRQEALEYERGCVLNYLEYTDASDGYMPIVIDSNTDPRLIKPEDISSTNMHKPVIAQHAAFLTRQSGGDAEWLREYFPKLEAFIRNYMTVHRDSATGLLYWQNDLAIGVDTDPSTFYRPDKSSGSIFLNCLMYRELLAMSYLAGELGLDKGKYEAMAVGLAESVRKWCWDEKDGFYYSVDLNLRPVDLKPQIIFGHSMILHKGAPRAYPCLIQRFGVWSGFMAMWAGIATPEQAERMVKENLLDPETFKGEYGVRTLSKMEKMYGMAATHNPSNWCGPVWGISNYLTFCGLLNYGYAKEATDLAEATVRLFGRDLEECGALHEYYDPDSGEPIINKGFQNWNYLVLNMIDYLDGRECVSAF